MDDKEASEKEMGDEESRENVLSAVAHLAGVEREIDAHLRALRRKLERAARRGEPVARIEARIRGEEELLRQMRARAPRRTDPVTLGTEEARGPEREDAMRQER